MYTSNILLTYIVVYSTILYWTTGLNPLADRYVIFVIVIILATLNAASLGYLISSISPSPQIANAIGPPIFIILLLYGGFYINSSSLPIGSEWVKYLSLVYWGFQVSAFTCNLIKNCLFCVICHVGVDYQ